VDDLFQGVDRAQADVKIVVAELLDGLGVAVGDLAPLGQLHVPAVHPERPQGTYADEPGQ
jgi:hypothetical protein